MIADGVVRRQAASVGDTHHHLAEIATVEQADHPDE
jgi:hypothetical protein